MVVCTKCHNEMEEPVRHKINRRVVVCPDCGYPTERKAQRMLIFHRVIIVILFLVVFVGAPVVFVVGRPFDAVLGGIGALVLSLIVLATLHGAIIDRERRRKFALKNAGGSAARAIQKEEDIAKLDAHALKAYEEALRAEEEAYNELDSKIRHVFDTYEDSKETTREIEDSLELLRKLNRQARLKTYTVEEMWEIRKHVDAFVNRLEKGELDTDEGGQQTEILKNWLWLAQDRPRRDGWIRDLTKEFDKRDISEEHRAQLLKIYEA